MKVAILMSTYNGAAFLQQQIDSILAQQGDFSFTLWVRDDASQDETTQILSRYAAQGKLHWYTGNNLKPAHSFYDLLLHCPGYDYYAFADQDDYWEPNKLQCAIDSIAGKTTPALACCNAQLVDSSLNSLGRNVYRSAPPLDFYTVSIAGGILGCTCVLNQSLAQLLQAKGAPGSIVMHDFYIALVCLLAGGEIHFDMTPHMKYRQHGNNVVGASGTKLAALKNRFRSVTHRARVTVSEQAQSLVSQFPELGTQQQKLWLRRLCSASLRNRFCIAVSRKTHYPNLNKSLTLRLAVFLGNR